MSYLKTKTLLTAIAAGAALFAFGAANAGTLSLDFDTSFGDPLDPGTSPPDGATPWFTAVFDDGGLAGSVTLTMTVPLTIGNADIDQVYFNLDPATLKILSGKPLINSAGVCIVNGNSAWISASRLPSSIKV